MEEDQDYLPSEEEEEDNIQIRVEKAEKEEIQLRKVYIHKEKELIEHYGILQNIRQQLWSIKQNDYDGPVRVDPFLSEYYKELAEEAEQFEDIKTQYSLKSDVDKDKRENELKKLEDINLSSKPPIEFFKAINDIHVGYKCLIEDLNNQIFRSYLQRVELEEGSQQFNQKIKKIRSEIKEIREKNEEIAKEIDNIKSNY